MFDWTTLSVFAKVKSLWSKRYSSNFIFIFVLFGYFQSNRLSLHIIFSLDVYQITIHSLLWIILLYLIKSMTMDRTPTRSSSTSDLALLKNITYWLLIFNIIYYFLALINIGASRLFSWSPGSVPKLSQNCYFVIYITILALTIN